MANSCDILLTEKYKIHLSITPSLGLIIINELEDFAENWYEVKVLQNSKLRQDFDIITFSGDSEGQSVCRFLIGAIHKKLHQNILLPYHQMASLAKYLVNIRLRQEILTNSHHLDLLSKALLDLLEHSLRSPSPHHLLGLTSLRSEKHIESILDPQP